ncbi:phosphotransferase family protein [Paenibacillus pinistramenti]|uniref:phosphotransferase family protein n=1 Tax=Paenibacillus pinistramenti TaxID=1768003 RepID=UPI0011090D4C|nr:aminoglycoside phosphotransferase family protein [Paenibacillus pinistramenti]
MKSLADYIAPDGSLDQGKIHLSVPLYQGMNGRFVERFYDDSGQSYIYKPVTQEGQEGREVWVYNHVLPKVAKVYPALLAYAGPSESGGAGWAVFEDLGQLSHDHRPGTLLRMARLAAGWHCLPAAEWEHAALASPKPPITQMAAELLGREEEAGRLLQEAGLPPGLIQRGMDFVNRSALVRAKVLNHGDLHAGNYARARGRLYVLDWEHAHLNSPLWDLYHLIDMSHPVYPRAFPITAELRERVLRGYALKLREYGRELDEQQLADDYDGYACLFSLWMLLLIGRDLQQGSVCWSAPQLLRQRTETMASLKECGLRFWQSGGGQGAGPGTDGPAEVRLTADGYTAGGYTAEGG